MSAFSHGSQWPMITKLRTRVPASWSAASSWMDIHISQAIQVWGAGRSLLRRTRTPSCPSLCRRFLHRNPSPLALLAQRLGRANPYPRRGRVRRLLLGWPGREGRARGVFWWSQAPEPSSALCPLLGRQYGPQALDPRQSPQGRFAPPDLQDPSGNRGPPSLARAKAAPSSSRDSLSVSTGARVVVRAKPK